MLHDNIVPDCWRAAVWAAVFVVVHAVSVWAIAYGAHGTDPIGTFVGRWVDTCGAVEPAVPVHPIKLGERHGSRLEAVLAAGGAGGFRHLSYGEGKAGQQVFQLAKTESCSL